MCKALVFWRLVLTTTSLAEALWQRGMAEPDLRKAAELVLAAAEMMGLWRRDG